ALLAFVTVSAPRGAAAQSDADRIEARHLFDEGQDALDRQDFSTAEDRFRRAYALVPAPTLRLGLARAQAALGRLVAAEETYTAIVREGAPATASKAFRDAVKDAEKELEALDVRL